MSALDPVVSVRPAYLPTGPRGDYRPEHRPYRRGEEARGDDVSRNEPSTSQEASAVQPTTSSSSNTRTPMPLPEPMVGAGEPPQDIEAGESPTESPATFTEGTQKDRVLAAVRHGARTTTEIKLRTGLLRGQVHKTVCWLVKKGELQDVPSDEERTVELAPPPGTRGVHQPVQDGPADEPEPAAAETARERFNQQQGAYHAY